MNEVTNYDKYTVTAVGKSAASAFEVVEVIKKLEIITPGEISQLRDAQAFTLSNFRDVPSYRPMIVKLTSVLNDAAFPTIDKKFWQCKIEAEVHFNELVRDYFKYEKSLVDIEEMQYKIIEIQSILDAVVEPNVKLDPNLLNFDKKRLIIKKSQYEYELKLLEKDIKYRIQEVVDWAFISKEIESKCEYSTSSYQEHTVKGHVLFIQNKLKSVSLSPEERKNLQSQLDTFNRLNKLS